MKLNIKSANRITPLLLAAMLAANTGLAMADSTATVPRLAQPKGASPAAEPAKPPTVMGEMVKLGPEDGNWVHLTKKQMLEDADYLYRILSENFPYFGLIKRISGVDMDAEFAVLRKEIETCETDAQFYVALDRWIRKAKGLGHLMLFDPFAYPWYAEIYQEGADDTGDELNRRRLAEVYNDKKALESYAGMLKIAEPIMARVQAYYASDEEGAAGEWKNIETKIIEPGKIAYIAINSFDNSRYDEDKKVLFDFYAQVKDYDHVIFDFTENGGGSMGYFNDLVAAPNTDKALSVKTYTFMKGGDYNRSFFDLSGYKPTSALPKLPRMNKDDLAGLDLYADNPYTIQPLGSGKMLSGKLWMLVSPNVFSSSEYAAMLCKDTGFMTLVGTRTGGDGIGSDPLPVVLPNSGFVVRYSEIYGTTADGASSQEWGTDPDIVSPPGKTALETCLEAIRSSAGQRP